MSHLLRTVPFLLLLLSVSCVNVDPKTGKTIPRGGQHYKMETVERLAKGLEVGMSSVTVTMMIGSPAEKSGDGVIWVYLPERPAVLIPSSALHLEFENGRLKSFGYRPIILGIGF